MRSRFLRASGAACAPASRPVTHGHTPAAPRWCAANARAARRARTLAGETRGTAACLRGPPRSCRGGPSTEGRLRPSARPRTLGARALHGLDPHSPRHAARLAASRSTTRGKAVHGFFRRERCTRTSRPVPHTAPLVLFPSRPEATRPETPEIRSCSCAAHAAHDQNRRQPLSGRPQTHKCIGPTPPNQCEVADPQSQKTNQNPSIGPRITSIAFLQLPRNARSHCWPRRSRRG